MGKIALRGQQGFCFRAAFGQHDVFPNTDGIASKSESFRFPHNKASRRSDPFSKNFLPIVIEGGRKIQKLTTAQGAQAGIEVIEPVIYQFKWNNLPMEPVAERREHTDVRSLPIAAEPGVGKSQEVPGSLEEAAWIQCDDFVPLPTKPFFKIRLFLPPFSIAKSARDCFASDDDTGIRRKHQVWQPWYRLHTFQDRTHILFEHVHEMMPLADSPI